MPLRNRKGGASILKTVWINSVVFLAIMTIAAGANLSAEAQGSKSEAVARSSSSRYGKIAAQQLVREVVQNELKGEQDPNLWRFRRLTWENGSEKLYDVVETNDGEVARLLAVNGEPLTAAQEQAEEARIQKLLSQPSMQQRQERAQSNDGDQETQLLRMLPNALLYTYAGRDGDVVKLTFQPNPKFQASTHEAQVFHHMSGVMLVNDKVKRLVELRGRLTSEVKFFWGILGWLNKGGTFKVTEGDVANGHWDVTFLQTNLDGKALFFKTITVHEKRIDSDYQRVPNDTTVKDAVAMLQKDGAPPAAAAGKTPISEPQAPGNFRQHGDTDEPFK